MARGPWRAGWPELAANLLSYGAEGSALPSVSGLAIRAPGSGPGTRAAGPRPPTILSEADSLDLLRAAGLRVVEATTASGADEAAAAARGFQGNVALKLDAVGLAHKSDLGGVVLGVGGDDAVREAASALLALGRRQGLTVRGLLVEPMVPAGLELIVGMRRDPQFGPIVLVGLGGTLAEVLDDVAIRLAPLDTADAEAMLDDLRGARVLGEIRGRPAIDRGAVASMLVALGRLAVDRADLLEVDLNPVIASSGGAIAVDALVILEGAGR
jgi:hypothetical protein